MTKPEEIREGIAEEVSYNMLGINYHELQQDRKGYVDFVAEAIVNKLASQDVVIQVNGKYEKLL